MGTLLLAMVVFLMGPCGVAEACICWVAYYFGAG